MMAVGLLGLFAACSSNPTAGEVADKAVPVVCEKLKECMGAESFDMDACRDTLHKGIDDRDKVSACDDATVDKCLSDFKAAECPADKQSVPKLPCDC